MELFLNLQDQDGNSYNNFLCEFGIESKLVDVKERIQSLYHIPHEFQTLHVEGKILNGLRHSSLQSQGLEDGSTIVIKHALLPGWAVFLKCEEAFQQTYEEELKKSIHSDAKKLINNLIQARFFETYSAFAIRRLAIENKFFTYFDRRIEAIQKSCCVYFTKQFGSMLDITFESREGGSRVGCLCVVKHGPTITKYHIKTNHGAGDKSSYARYDIDLKELFVYKLLEDLKIGAEVQFIDNESFSKWIIYIGTKDVKGFRTLEYLEVTQPQALKEYSQSVVQMLFIFSVLMLGDHHIANIGFDCADNPFIVDFFVIGKPLFSVKDLYDTVRMAKTINLNLGNFDERLEISTEYLKSSNFSSVFEKSISSFLVHQKTIFDKTLLVFDELQKTDDLMEYVDNVRKNIKLFINEE